LHSSACAILAAATVSAAARMIFFTSLNILTDPNSQVHRNTPVKGRLI
jgi:hypothetical protein